MCAASRENLYPGIPTRFDKNLTVRPQQMANGLKFQIKVVVGLIHCCCENKGADQLRSNHAADLRLCFRIFKKAGFLMT